MLKLFLHIGPHKTGTTSFQKYCHDNYQRLLKLGICYPRFKGAKHHHGSICADVLQDDSFCCRLRDKIINEAEKNKCAIILISSEMFGELLIEHPKKFEFLIEFLKSNFNFSIIYVERNIEEITKSGFYHFLRIINSENISFLSKQFNIPVNNKNLSFDPKVAKTCIKNWITELYIKIRQIKCHKLKIDYGEVIQKRLLVKISKETIVLFSKITEGVNENSNIYPDEIYDDYSNYCSEFYAINGSKKLITFEKHLINLE